MRWNTHTKLVGQHAFLSPSKPAWANYTDDKLDRMYVLHRAAVRGTELHAFAHEAIRLGIRLPRTTKTLNMYVNDAIGYRMSSEQVLFYSLNAFGTADAISFRRNLLRIHDLKTGVTPANPAQLQVYAALFCLEYRMKPFDIDMDMRIYQNDEIVAIEHDPDRIMHIMDRIVVFDRQIEAIKEEEEA